MSDDLSPWGGTYEVLRFPVMQWMRIANDLANHGDDALTDIIDKAMQQAHRRNLTHLEIAISSHEMCSLRAAISRLDAEVARFAGIAT